MSYKSILNNSGKNTNVLTIIKDVFKYYKIPIMAIFSLFLVKNSFSKLGTTSGLFSLLVVALIYFGIVTIGIFIPTNHKEHLSPITSYEQATKSCSTSFSSNQQTNQQTNQQMGGNGEKGINNKYLSKELKAIYKLINK